MNLKHQKQTTMRQLIFLSTLLFVPFLMNAQTKFGTGTGTGGGISSSYFGYQSARLITQGQRYNTMVGYRTGYNLSNSNSSSQSRENSFFGASTGLATTTGRSNTFMGQASGRSNTSGSYNTVLGMQAGYKNKYGHRNVMIGYMAGYEETGSDKLYIDNSNTSSPLIHGDFSTNLLTINGTMSIGNVTTPSGYKLYVEDGILTEKVKVAEVSSDDWMDIVFEEDYDLNTIEKVETFIKENKHLPNVPSAKEVSENGIEMVEMDATLLRHIEELWLHMIELKKEMNVLNDKEEVDEGETETNAVLLRQIEELRLLVVELNEKVEILEKENKQLKK